MYHGEVNVTQEDIEDFLAVAEDLKVKGLTQNYQLLESQGKKKNGQDLADLSSNSPERPRNNFLSVSPISKESFVSKDKVKHEIEDPNDDLPGDDEKNTCQKSGHWSGLL